MQLSLLLQTLANSVDLIKEKCTKVFNNKRAIVCEVTDYHVYIEL